MNMPSQHSDRLGRVQAVHGHHEHAVAAHAHQEGVERFRDVGAADPFAEARAAERFHLVRRHHRHVGEELECRCAFFLLDLQPVEDERGVEMLGG
jgi:hypothetical protein